MVAADFAPGNVMLEDTYERVSKRLSAPSVHGRPLAVVALPPCTRILTRGLRTAARCGEQLRGRARRSLCHPRRELGSFGRTGTIPAPASHGLIPAATRPESEHLMGMPARTTAKHCSVPRTWRKKASRRRCARFHLRLSARRKRLRSRSGRMTRCCERSSRSRCGTLAFRSRRGLNAAHKASNTGPARAGTDLPRRALGNRRLAWVSRTVSEEISR